MSMDQRYPQYLSQGVQQQYPPLGAQQQYPPQGAQQQYPGNYAGTPQYPGHPSYGAQPQYPGRPTYSGQPQYSPTDGGYSIPQPRPQVYPYGSQLQNPPIYSYGNPGNASLTNPDSDTAHFVFTSKSIRLAFIRKVYAILSLQMVITIGLMALMLFVEPIKLWVQRNKYLYIVAIAIVIVLMVVLGCFTGPRRKFPLNIILLLAFTLAESFMLGVISISKDTRYVAYATVITLAIVVAITIFAFQTKIDFTYLSGGLLILSIVFLAFGIFALIMRNRLVNLIYCCIGVLIFSIFLLVDTQLMLGGNHSYSISPEDYIFAALNLYVDIVQIFLMVLGIFSNSD